MKFKIALLCFTLTACLAASAQEQSSSGNTSQDAVQQQLKELQERIIALEGQVRMLKAQQTSATNLSPNPATSPNGTAVPQGASQPESSVGIEVAGSVPQPATQRGGSAPQGSAPTYGGASGMAKALNPDISMIGDFLGSVGGNSIPTNASQEPFRSLEMHESELGIQAVIDPYARGDFFLTFGENGVGLEEGYITLTALPAGFVGKIGKMRAAFGKVNTLHNHVLPWADRPLVTDNLVGGEDGINDAGVSVTRAFAAPKGVFLEATGQLLRGDSGDALHPLFTSTQKSDVSTVAHLRGYKDITESTNLDIGVSYARGHNGVGSDFLTKLYGVDATLRWKPLRRSIYHSFIGRGEFIWSQRQQLTPIQRAFGYYVSGDYQLGRRWFVGGRFDQSDRAAVAGTDHGTSGVLTYWPSEFSQLRWQYRNTRFAEGRDANELLMQVQFVLGAHGAHPF